MVHSAVRTLQLELSTDESTDSEECAMFSTTMVIAPPISPRLGTRVALTLSPVGWNVDSSSDEEPPASPRPLSPTVITLRKVPRCQFPIGCSTMVSLGLGSRCSGSIRSFAWWILSLCSIFAEG